MSTESRRILSILDLVKHQPATAGCGKPASHGLEALDDCAVVPISESEDLIIGTDFVRVPVSTCSNVVFCPGMTPAITWLVRMQATWQLWARRRLASCWF